MELCVCVCVCLLLWLLCAKWVDVAEVAVAPLLVFTSATGINLWGCGGVYVSVSTWDKFPLAIADMGHGLWVPFVGGCIYRNTPSF